MKNLKLQTLIILISIILPITLSAQKKKSFQLVTGISNNIELTFQNTHSNTITNIPGLFVGLRWKRFFTITSFSYAHRRFGKEVVGTFSFRPTTPLDQKIIMSWFSEGHRLKTIEFGQFFKINIINKKRFSYFIGGGILLRLPQEIDFQPIEFLGEVTNVDFEKSELEKGMGYNMAIGFDYKWFKKFHLSTQLGWNTINKGWLFSSPSYFFDLTNKDNAYLKISLGYQLR